MIETGQARIDPPRHRPRSASARIVSGFGVATCALCLSLVVLVVALASFTLIPIVFGWQPHLILTGSMAPSIMPGDVIVSAPIRRTDIMPGRVLLMKNPSRPGELLVHRMVSANDDGTIVTRGDANQSADSTPVKLDDVRGLPRLRIPMIGLPSIWLRHRDWPRLGGTAFGLMFAVWGALGVRAGIDEDIEPSNEKAANGVPAMSA